MNIAGGDVVVHDVPGITFGAPARPSVPLTSGHLTCTDTFLPGPEGVRS